MGSTLGEFSKTLRMVVDRPVIDKTGVSGLYDFHFEYADETVRPGSALLDPAEAVEPAGPSIFTALQDLGLKLEPAKGTGHSIVVDSIERPSEN